MFNPKETIRAFLQINSLLLTLISSLFLLRGNVGLTPSVMAELSVTKVGYNLDVLQSLAGQAADTWVGMFLILLAFFIQVVALCYPVTSSSKKIWLRATGFSVVTSILFFVVATEISNSLRNSYAKKTIDIVNQKMK